MSTLDGSGGQVPIRTGFADDYTSTINIPPIMVVLVMKAVLRYLRNTGETVQY